MGCIGTGSAACYKHLHNTVKCVFILRKENMKLCTIILHLLPANPCGKVTLQIHRSN